MTRQWCASLDQSPDLILHVQIAGRLTAESDLPRKETQGDMMEWRAMSKGWAWPG